jgi:hypothetical protein
MKNKNILYGLLAVGALAGFYFFNKNKKGNNNISNEVLIDDSKKSAFNNEEIEKLSREFADEFVSEAKKEITNLELQPVTKTAISSSSDKTSVLEVALINYKNDSQKKQIDSLKMISNNYGNLYKSFKKSIPNFDNLSDLTMAKNILLKLTILGDSKAVLTNEEQIFLANAESNKNIMKFGDTIGFDMSDVFPKNNKTEKKPYMPRVMPSGLVLAKPNCPNGTKKIKVNCFKAPCPEIEVCA